RRLAPDVIHIKSSPVTSRHILSSIYLKTLAFTFVRELTWKPLHLHKIHILQFAIACNTSLFPSLINVINQVAFLLAEKAILARGQAPFRSVLN
ncbi:MAG: hypothetical protein PHR10_07040, partial [Sphaerochaetaceae bacterium]|nr:hypothetical protein [Sphaerochaetaceae bacterium]MDY0370802.1 hypothetical protein [Sphaerochaetaceae bacterium]